MKHFCSLTVAFTLLCVGAEFRGPGYQGRANAAEAISRFPRTSATVLRLARSEDGLTFTDSGTVFLQRAAGPDLVELSRGQLLALFDYAGGDDPADPTMIAVSRSRDSGQSWSPARPIRLKGAMAKALRARHGDLVPMPSGRFRLYFSSVKRVGRDAKHRTGSSGTMLIGSAVTLNGIDYHVDGRTRIRLRGTGDVHPVVGRLSPSAGVGTRFHLYVARLHEKTVETDDPRASAHHFVSRDGRRFARLRTARTPGAGFVGSIIATDSGLRAFVSSGRGIGSLTSRNGRDWVAQAGLRLASGWDPAVVRLKDGSYLMLYCAPMDEASAAAQQLVDASFDRSADDDAVMIDAADIATQIAERIASADSQDAVSDEAAELASAEAVEVGAEKASDLAVLADADRDGDPVGEATPEAAPAEKLADADDGDGDSAAAEWFAQPGDGLEDWDPLPSDGFAPEPDFLTKVNYLEWYHHHALDHPEDNAYEAYARFLPLPHDQPGDKPEWPEMNDMFNGDYDGPPAPWEPADHPDWEETHWAVGDLLEQFREASTHKGYAPSLEASMDHDSSLPDGENLLLNIILPSLSPHRKMVKATLADAWRKQDGKVSPERMMEAWKTSFRAASHLRRGATLIEDLVSTADNALVQKNARWALKHGVFNDKELQTAFDTLREHDRDDWDPGVPLRGEHAMGMDMTQWLFTPPTADGRPQINRKHAEAMSSWALADETGPDDRLRDVDSDDAYATMDAIDAHYRELTDQMYVGYPDVRASDVKATLEKYRQATPVTDLFLPNLSRYYKLKARLETSRRATQLAYATHLFKARTGRWPESLDDLPAEYGETIRIDPFTGNQFGYRVTDDGPTIYSLSENGIDDGGVHAPRWDDKTTSDAPSDDHVFWPPQAPR